MAAYLNILKKNLNYVQKTYGNKKLNFVSLCDD